MPSLRETLRETICQAVRGATAEELMSIVLVLADDEMARAELVPTAAAVRTNGRQFALRHDDEVVLDCSTGLMWSRAELTQDRLTWADADKLCRELRLGGYSDWRLPTIDELFALADRTRHEPAIDTTFFPGCKPNAYWAGTPYAPSPGDCAWGVGFYNGLAHWFHRDYNGFVRAVRASQ